MRMPLLCVRDLNEKGWSVKWYSKNGNVNSKKLKNTKRKFKWKNSGFNKRNVPVKSENKKKELESKNNGKN